MSPIQVHFYLLAESAVEACLRHACRLVEKYYLDGKIIYIHTLSHLDAQRFDDLLWTFHDTSFLPHEIIRNQRDLAMPISIGDGDICADLSGDLLINLTADIPKFFVNFKQLFEIVPNDEVVKTSARKRYKFYQKQNCSLKIYDMARNLL